MRPAVRWLLLAIAAAIIIVVAALPPTAVITEAPAAGVVRGAYHVHTTRSDGSGTPDEVAEAAARAGLHFVILTDHGAATRTPDPAAYRSGVLTVDAVELNTTGGHLVALGLGAAPYPLAGTPGDVLEDVHRLGGVAVAAHPGSPRPPLQWDEWDAPIDGVEWLNGDSEWRDEPRLPLARALLSYPFRSAEAMGRLLDRPSAALRRWDELNMARRVFTLAGLDAHARLGEDAAGPDDVSAHLPLPGYEAAFRTLSNHVVLDAPFSGNAAEDAARLLAAIRAGRSYSVIDALATPGALVFTATSGADTVGIGGDIQPAGDVVLRASAAAPPGTTLVLIRNGERVHEVTDGALAFNGGRERAAYRVEAYVAGGPGGPPVPWIVSNAIYAGPPPPAPGKTEPAMPAARIPARVREATAEMGRTDRSALGTPPRDPLARTPAGEPPMAWSYALGPGVPAGQFAAVQVPLGSDLPAFERVRFRVTAPRPVRAWIQLRVPNDTEDRWGATFYADATERTVDVPFSAFRPIGDAPAGPPPLGRVRSLLFVVDTLNSRPGATGSMTLTDVGFVK